MHCDHCAHKVRTLLHQNEGVGHLSFDLERHTATIAYDPTITCVDSIKSQLAATKRYAASDYSKDDVIYNETGLHIDDMFCGKCANRIVERLNQLSGVDSIAPHIGKHFISIRYDANKTHLKDIRIALSEIGFTPVRHYENERASYAFFTLPTNQVTEETTDAILALDGVADVFVNGKKGTLAVTFDNTETSTEKLREQIRAENLSVEVPPAHQCKEKTE